jgi:hypothetical protein
MTARVVRVCVPLTTQVSQLFLAFAKVRNVNHAFTCTRLPEVGPRCWHPNACLSLPPREPSLGADAGVLCCYKSAFHSVLSFGSYKGDALNSDINTLKCKVLIHVPHDL